MSDLTSPLWGTGYGSKRHLVDGKPAAHPTKGWRMARSHCGQMLDLFADSDGPSGGAGTRSQAEVVASRPACARCARIAIKEEAQA